MMSHNSDFMLEHFFVCLDVDDSTDIDQVFLRFHHIKSLNESA